MAEDIGNRVLNSFAASNEIHAEKYLDWLRDTMKDWSGTVRSTVTRFLILIVLFQLIKNANLAEFDLGSIKIKNSGVLLLFVPTGASFLFMQLLVATTKYNRLAKTFSSVFEKWDSEAEENDLHSLIFPAEPIYWNPVSGGIRSGHKNASDRLEEGISLVMIIIVVLTGIGFPVYAFYELFSSMPVLSLPLWFNLVLSVAFIAGALAHLVVSIR